jgi:acetyl esterase/lipase
MKRYSIASVLVILVLVSIQTLSKQWLRPAASEKRGGMASIQTQPKQWQPSNGHTQIPIWPGTPPDSDSPTQSESATITSGKDMVAGKPYTWVENVTRPTLTFYSPKTNNTGAAIVVFPGGGYKGLAIDLEGSEVCDWLTLRGITCVLLKYRVPDSGPHHDDKCDCRADAKAPMALEDAQRTLGLVRHHAAEWHIDPHKIGVMGFSAGGHLVADISTRWDKRLYPSVDDADKESCRPDFAVAVYPGHMLEKTTKEFELNPTLPVSKETPPTFLLQSVKDPVDDVQNSLVYFIALRKAGVSVEMHLYAEGGHGFGLRRTQMAITEWAQLLEAWMRSIQILPARSS